MPQSGVPTIYNGNNGRGDLSAANAGRAAMPYNSASVEFGEPATDWQRYSRAVKRRWRVALVIVLLGIAAGVYASGRLSPSYNARASLWLEQPGTYRGAVPVGETETAVPASSWTELARSSMLLTPVVTALRLYVEPEDPTHHQLFRGMEPRGELRPGSYEFIVSDDGRSVELHSETGVVERAAMGAPVGETGGFTWTPPAGTLRPGDRVEFEITPVYTAVQNLARALRPTQDPGGSLLTLELRGNNPPLLAETVNSLARGVEELATVLQRRKYEEQEVILREQYENAGSVLREAENRLTAHQVSTAGVVQGSSPILTGDAGAIGGAAVSRAFEQRIKLEELRRDAKAIETAMTSAKTGQGFNIEALAVVPSVRESPALANLMDELVVKEAELRALTSMSNLTDAAAPVVRKREELKTLQTQIVPAAAGQLLNDIRAREAVLSRSDDSMFTAMRNIPTLMQSSVRLERAVMNAENIHTAIGNRHESVRLALLSSTPTVRIMDEAQPPTNAAIDLAPMLLLVSILGSVGFGVLGAVIADRKDSRVRFPEQVVQNLRLPILAALPHVGHPRMRKGLKQSNEIIEALRALRVRLLHLQGVDGPLMLTVSSPAAGEGKSFVSVNLALSFAHAGYRTLLFDGDLRRGVQHRTLEAHGAPGVTDILSGATTLEEAVQKTTYNDLFLLSSGTRMQRAPELLQSPAMRELLALCRSRYDVVVVDSPPLAAGVDPLVLATLTTNLLLVIRSDETDMQMASAKLEVAQSLPVRTIGAVLNGVRAQSAFRYYAYDLTGYTELPDETGERPEPFDKVLSGRLS